MNTKLFGPLRAALAILVPGGLAASIVVRTLAVYWGRDWLASTVIVAIALALSIGLLELVARQSRLAQLERELRALPRTPDATTLATAGPQLSPLLRARLEQQPLPPTSDGLAVFLTGLLVMLGLLGTLLGLFQTLHGAGHALTSSADVDALRRGLSAPIAGLTRAFGCAAAGISASAMLGLANALLRRRESRALRAVYAYALGPLREHSVSARQLRAIEQLASASTSSSALPAAAAAIERVSEQLGEVSGKLISLQQTALEAQQKGVRELLAEVRRDLAKAARESAAALQAQVAPGFEQLAARSGEVLERQSAAFAQVAADLGRELEQDAVRRRAEAAEALAGMRARLDDAEAARAAAHAQELAALTGLHAHAVAESERREHALGERWQELIERLDAQLEAARESEAERLRSLDAQVYAARDRELEHADRLASSSAQLHGELERLSSTLNEELEQRVSNERRQIERVERALARLTAAGAAVEHGIAQQEGVLERLVERVSPLFESAAQSTREAAERAFERIEQSAGLLETTIAQQGGAIEGLVERVSALLPELAAAAQAGAVDTLERLRGLAEKQAEQLTKFEAALALERQEHARGIAEQLGDHAAGFDERASRTSRAVEEAAAIWQASTVEMQAVAQLFATSVERQREAAESWLESLGAIESAVEHSGREAASDALSEQLASTQELFARQLQFQRELLTQLRTLRAGASKTRDAHGGQDVSPGE